MRFLFLFLLALVGCAHTPKPSPKGDLVSVDAALDHIQMSYLKGCVDAHLEMNKKKMFVSCSIKAKTHRIEVEETLNSPVTTK